MVKNKKKKTVNMLQALVCLAKKHKAHRRVFSNLKITFDVLFNYYYFCIKVPG